MIMPVYHCREVLECFRREELLEWSWLQTKYASSLRDGASDGPAPLVFSRAGEVGEQQWEDFRKRVIEHVSEPLCKGYHFNKQWWASNGVED